MTLGEKQEVFLRNAAKLILWAFDRGYRIRGGELLRTKEQQEIYIKTGRSKTMNSRHLDKLAIDLNLIKDGKLSNDSKDYQPLGEYWMSLNPANVWGSDWNRNHSFLDERFLDPYHFEMRP